MSRSKILGYVAAVALGLGGAGAASAATVFDSGGFEALRYSSVFVNGFDPLVVGNIRGQDSGAIANGWLQSGAQGGNSVSTAVVQAGQGLTGQGVKVTRVAEENRWSPDFNGVITSSVVDVSWDQRTLQSTDPNPYGPGLGVDVWSTNNHAGFVGVDAKTGEVLFLKPGTFDVVTSHTVVNFNQWYHFRARYDFTNHTYSGFISPGGGGAETALFLHLPFYDTSTPAFRFAFLAGLLVADPNATDPGDRGNNAGTAYFDNYVVAAVVPEPSVMGLGLIVAGAGLARRRRR